MVCHLYLLPPQIFSWVSAKLFARDNNREPYSDRVNIVLFLSHLKQNLFVSNKIFDDL